jgi:hypothetical protein
MTWEDGLARTKPQPAGEAPAVPRATPGDDRARRYALRALESECRTVAQSAPGGRNNALNIAALKIGQLVAGGSLTDSEAFEALSSAAQQCGLGPSETRATISSGMSAGAKEPRTAPERATSPNNGAHASTTADDYVHDDADAPDAPAGETPREEREPRAQPTRSDPLRGLDRLAAVAVIGREAIETLAREPVEYAWQDVVVTATIALIAGPPSGGKTTLLFLVLAARLGTSPANLLGRDVQPSNAGQYLVLIEGEHSESSSARKLVKSLDLLGVEHDALERCIIVARKAVRLGSPEWADVGRMVAAGLVSDIALDTVARIAPADGSSESEQVAIFDAVARTIELAPEDRKPTVWAVAHVRKNGKTDDVDDVSGSAQRTGQADSVLLIRPEKVGGRTVSTTVVFAKLREDPDDRWPEPATFSIVTADGQRELRQDGAKADDGRPLEVRITDLLALGPRTKNAIASTLGRSKADVDDALSNLFGARAIRTCEVTVRGNTRKGFGLAPDPQNLTGRSRDEGVHGTSRDD